VEHEKLVAIIMRIYFLEPQLEEEMQTQQTRAGDAILLLVSGAFPQNHGTDFETSYLNTKKNKTTYT
jgi:hypothetical protein